MKKILLVDDSALMRRVMCDIINSDNRFEVEDRAANGLDAFDFLSRKSYDAVVLDVNMPKMNGLELLEELKKYKISARVMMASTDTKEGAKITLDALELGALDFIHKPSNILDCRTENFKEELLRVLNVVANSQLPVFESKEKEIKNKFNTMKVADIVGKHELTSAKKIIAIASSTGGPKSLQSVIPSLPANLNAPVLVVQHMPMGFTASLAERLNGLSEIRVKEGEEGEVVQAGTVYVAQGGRHMQISNMLINKPTIHYTDEPNREGVKPCANYMYESLMNSSYEEVLCVVMTGMGADGTEGIQNLATKKKIHVIAQNQETCTVYGMPKNVVNAGLSNQIVALDKIAQEIIINVGVKKDGC